MKGRVVAGEMGWPCRLAYNEADTTPIEVTRHSGDPAPELVPEVEL